MKVLSFGEILGMFILIKNLLVVLRSTLQRILQNMVKKHIQFFLKYASKIAGYVVSEFDAVPDYNLNDFVLS